MTLLPRLREPELFDDIARALEALAGEVGLTTQDARRIVVERRSRGTCTLTST